MLVTLATNYLAGPLSQSINNSIKKGMFPENAKVASVNPRDKKTDDKNSVLNFRPVSVLNCFSKVYEKILKTKLLEKMKQNFRKKIYFPLLSLRLDNRTIRSMCL